MNPSATHLDRIAFHVAGRRAPGLGEVGRLRPALQAGYRDLTSLRHDFPLVLAREGAASVLSLRALIDAALARVAVGSGAERTQRHVLRIERELRVMLQEGREGTLGELWTEAVQRLAPARDASFVDNARRARAAIEVDGALVGCDPSLAECLLRHVWQRVQQGKEAALRDRLVRLIQQLADILRADFEHSGAGRSATRLKASVGGGLGELFDFDAMSSLLSRALPREPMPEARRSRIRRLLGVLDSQPFVALPDADAAREAGHEPYGYLFDSCASALAAWNERLPRLVELARTIEMAQLEIEGRYDPARHDALFDAYAANGFEREALDRFPDYLVCLDGGTLAAAEQARLMDILGGEVPIKVLYRIDDLLAAPQGAHAPPSPGLRERQIAHMAMGLNQVYVLQSAASNLGRCAERVAAGMRFGGPALFCVFSGARGGVEGQAPYLTAAAAMESRAFPAFVYDPSGGPDWASRFSLEGNPQPELDWPIHRFEYEDARQQRVVEDLAFTFADFAAGDPRFAAHLARLPGAPADDDLVAVDALLLRDRRGLPEQVPCVRMIDAKDRLHTVIVDAHLMHKARRSREMWHSLQELGGVHNSHAERLLARERAAWESEQAEAAPAAAEAAGAAAPATIASPGAGPALAPAAEAGEAQAPEAPRSRDDAYIETPRCSTCNECTQINPKMFAYDGNRQAYIADLKAGTYAQLVEAAESCQVSVIHPGKPWNPGEPGLEDLLARAESFR